jgi:large subunit ribosomal protein L30
MSPKLRITLVRSVAKCTDDVRGTVAALGIRKLNHSVVKVDTPQMRGMIKKIVHLLKVEEVKA